MFFLSTYPSIVQFRVSRIGLIIKVFISAYVTLCAICFRFNNFKNVKNIHERVILLVKLQVVACNFTKNSITPLWVFFTFFKLCKWCQVAQSIADGKWPYSNKIQQTPELLAGMIGSRRVFFISELEIQIYFGWR